MPGDSQPLLPAPIDGDPEDVAWALQTADALWKRGEYADAVGWIRKAANAAAEAEHDMRVITLAKAAADLTALVEAFGAAAPPEPERVPSGVDIDVDVADESSPMPAAVAAPPPPPKKPPGPPPKKPGASPRLPTPNPVPSPLREVPFAEVASAATADAGFVGAPPPADPIPPSHDPDSAGAFPSVPPAPPDFAPTPMAMPVAKSIPPDREPPRPRVAIAPERTSRTSTAPFGTPSRPPPAPKRLDPDATIEDSLEPAIEIPRPPLRPASIPPRLSENPDVVTSARSVPPPRPSGAPRLGTPVMGSVPPPRVSLAPSAAPANVGEDGVQRHVSDAPPRHAQSAPPVHIPPPPRTPTVHPQPSQPPPQSNRLKTTLGFPSVQPPPKVVHAPALSGAPFTGKTVLLDPSQFEVLADVPDDAREALVRQSEKVALLPDEVASAPAMVIVMQGELEVRAPGFVTHLDVISAGQVRVLVAFAPADGSLLVVGGPKGARYLSLGLDAIELLRAAAPWVVQELEPASDDLHVVAGLLRGRFGRRLDGAMIEAILSRAKTMRLAPGAKVVKQGEAVRALILVGAGELTMRGGDDAESAILDTVPVGDFLFATELLGRRASPATVRAGDRGALVIVATRAATEELLVTVPPLLELLGDA